MPPFRFLPLVLAGAAAFFPCFSPGDSAPPTARPVHAALSPVSLQESSQTLREENLREVEAVIALVEHNYSGYNDQRKRFGAGAIDRGTKLARERAAKSTTAGECNRILYDYLRLFKDGHLSVVWLDANGKQVENLRRMFGNPESPAAANWSDEPSGRILSSKTFLITVPDFDLSHKAALDALIRQQDAEIKSRPNLILDVRGNSGGSTAAYSSLRPLLYTQPVKTVGVDVLATKANADAWEAWLREIPPTDTKQIAEVKDILKRMREAREGTFVSTGPDSTDTLPGVFPLPKRAAILIDRRCASTTEQFLLEAKQSKKVQLYGQTTKGVLDYANVRSFSLPSHERVLEVPTTRSRRLPKGGVDPFGIKPDRVISPLTQPQIPQDTAIALVQAMLERKTER